MTAVVGNITFQELRLCDWERSVAECEDSSFAKILLIVSGTSHLLVGTFGIWVLWYRNGGFNANIVTNLYIFQRNNIRPKPIDCMGFFTTGACFVKVLASSLIVLDMTPLWFRVMLQQGYWWLAFPITTAAYIVGALYALPVTECRGSFAVYRPQEIDPFNRRPPIYVYHPTPNQRDAFLLISLTMPIICAIMPGIISAALEMQGHLKTSLTLVTVQYIAWGVQEYALSAILLYYGLKFAIVLRAHITATEARDNVPPKAFGYGDLKSGSPARYLLIMVKITVTARGLILLFSGTLAYVLAWIEGDPFRLANERLSHVIAVFSSLIVLLHFGQLSLITVHCSRSRRKYVNDLDVHTSDNPSIIDQHHSLRLLTLNFESDNTYLPSSDSFERALSQLANAQQLDEEPSEHPISTGNAQSETYVDEEDLRKRVARSTLFSFWRTARKSRGSTTSGIIPGLSNSPSGLEAQVYEFRMLQLQHQSSSRRLGTLEINQPNSMGQQNFRILRRQLQDAHQSLERLRASYHQLHPLPAYQPGEVRAETDAAESLRLLHLRSNVSILQQQVKFMLQQVDLQIRACEPDPSL